jgi:hypothetical protein
MTLKNIIFGKLGLNDEIKTNSIKEPRQKIRNKKNKN